VKLRDDLLNYMARNGRDSIALERPGVVIIGELHGRLSSNDAAVRTTAAMLPLHVNPPHDRLRRRRQRLRRYGPSVG
jgi:hypothetical protein